MNKINAVYLAIAALIVALIALVMCVICCSQKKSQNIEEVLMNNPGIIAQAQERYQQQQQEEAARKRQEMVKANLEALNNNPDDGILGNPDGDVTIVEFFDFACGYCHRIYPVLKNVMARNPNVKMVAKPVTFVSQHSGYAAKAALAAKEQGKFAEAYEALFSIKGPLTPESIDGAMAGIGVDMDQLKTDMNSAKVINNVNSVAELLGNIQITGVPTLVINGEIVQTLDEGVIQEKINAAKQ